MTVTRRWTTIGLALALVVLLAAWFGVVSPKRGEAAELRQNAEDVRASTSSLRTQLSTLQAQAERLPEMRAELAEIQTRIPEEPSLPALVRQLTAAAETSGATLVSVAPGEPAPYLAPGAAPADPSTAVDVDGDGDTADSAAADDSTTEEGDDAATTDPAAAAPAAPTLVAVPVALEVRGGFFQLQEFLSELERLPRAYLVGALAVETEEDDEGGSASTVATITGSVWMAPAAGAALPVAVAPAAPDAEGAPAPADPAAPAPPEGGDAAADPPADPPPAPPAPAGDGEVPS